MHLDELCRAWPTTISLFMRGAIRREWGLYMERLRHERLRREKEEGEVGGNTDTEPEQNDDQKTVSETKSDDGGRDPRDPYVAFDG